MLAAGAGGVAEDAPAETWAVVETGAAALCARIDPATAHRSTAAETAVIVFENKGSLLNRYG